MTNFLSRVLLEQNDIFLILTKNRHRQPGVRWKLNFVRECMSTTRNLKRFPNGSKSELTVKHTKQTRGESILFRNFFKKSRIYNVFVCSYRERVYILRVLAACGIGCLKQCHKTCWPQPLRGKESLKFNSRSILVAVVK